MDMEASFGDRAANEAALAQAAEQWLRGARHAGILGSQASHTPSASVGVADPCQAGEFEQGDQTQRTSLP
jgi:hypothetical protein